MTGGYHGLRWHDGHHIIHAGKLQATRARLLDLAQLHGPSLCVDFGLELLYDRLRVERVRLLPEPHPDLL